MAATGKKSKKIKGKTLGLSEFLGDTPVGVIQLQAKNWAEDDEDYGTGSGGYSSRMRMPVALPSASRESRGGVIDDESVPHYPPYMAYLSNLPYEVEDATIHELFPDLKVISLRLPREMDGQRGKGFGYVEFEDRDGLVAAVNMHDLQLSGRRVRVDVAEAGDRKFGGRRSDRDREREYDPERTSGDWRAGPRTEPEGEKRKSDWGSGGGGGSFRRDDRDRDGPDAGGSWRDAPRDAPPPREGDRERGGGGFGRGDGEGGFRRDEDRDRGGFGGRGDGERSFRRDGDRDRGFGGRDGGERRDFGFGRDGGGDRSFSRDGDRRDFSRDGDRRDFSRDGDRRDFGRDGDRGFGGRDSDRGFGGRDGGRREGGFGRSFGDRDRDRDERNDSAPTTRPKLNLLPRTVPLNNPPPPVTADNESKKDNGLQKESNADSGSDQNDGANRAASPERRPAYKPPVPASSIFGAAKPVDTSAREREIEERLMKKAEEMKLRDPPKDREEKWRDRKDDYGSGPRRSDDRAPRPYNSRDSKEYADRDSRPYRGNSRDNKDRDMSDHSSQDSRRDKRDSKDSRDGGYSRGSRDNSRDNREHRESRPTVRDSREYSGNRDSKDTAERDVKEKKERNYEERPLPKAKDHEPPNFVAPNKFSQLKNEDDDESE